MQFLDGVEPGFPRILHLLRQLGGVGLHGIRLFREGGQERLDVEVAEGEIGDIPVQEGVGHLDAVFGQGRIQYMETGDVQMGIAVDDLVESFHDLLVVREFLERVQF